VGNRGVGWDRFHVAFERLGWGARLGRDTVILSALAEPCGGDFKVLTYRDMSVPRPKVCLARIANRQRLKSVGNVAGTRPIRSPIDVIRRWVWL
jgi:hypothetical protein